MGTSPFTKAHIYIIGKYNMITRIPFSYKNKKANIKYKSNNLTSNKDMYGRIPHGMEVEMT